MIELPANIQHRWLAESPTPCEPVRLVDLYLELSPLEHMQVHLSRLLVEQTLGYWNC